ncbi:MAG: hypothetical protein IJ848_00280 [Alphaproteobacteria bacterium]|nr:hypothetical protein [Alphaproteobacteria bacterium]
MNTIKLNNALFCSISIIQILVTSNKKEIMDLKNLVLNIATVAETIHSTKSKYT